MSYLHSKDNPLQQLLRRGDVWRGQSGVPPQQPHWSSGHPSLDSILAYRGWPLGQLLETCQPKAPYAEWLLWGPTIAHCSRQEWVTVLLNPPATPFLAGVQPLHIDPAALWLVEIQHRQDFVPTLAELLSSHSIAAIFAWEPTKALSYGELRKVQLAQQHTQHLCCLFRNHRQSHQSSPAALRMNLQLKADHLAVDIFKQKGSVHQLNTQLPLPEQWCTSHSKPSPKHPTTPITPLPTSVSR